MERETHPGAYQVLLKSIPESKTYQLKLYLVFVLTTPASCTRWMFHQFPYLIQLRSPKYASKVTGMPCQTCTHISCGTLA